MNRSEVLAQAARGRLYPSVILYGRSLEERQESAVEIARALLCERPEAERPCPDPQGRCRHCRRLAWPGKNQPFHPDIHVLERDLRTSTSIDATRRFLSVAYEAPFEARGQIFVVAEADTLSDGAADTLLKLLEEPPVRSPRHFLLLAPSRLDLLPTLRSRSLAVFLGSPEAIDEEMVGEIVESFGTALEGWSVTASPVYLLAAAGALKTGKGWEDPRARKPWAAAAAAVVRSLERVEGPQVRRALLAFAEELLDAPRMRVRAVTPVRILEGLLARHLAGTAG